MRKLVALAAAVAGAIIVPATAGGAPVAVTADTYAYLVITAPNDTAGAKSAIGGNGGTVHASYDPIGVIVARSAAIDFAERMRAVGGVQQVGKTRTRAVPAGAGADGTDEPSRAELQRRMLEPTLDRTSAAQQADEPVEWDMRQVKADQAWPVNSGSRDVVVGVLDTGIDDTHEDLSANFDAANSVSCVGGKANTAAGAWRPTTSESGSDHGTHVAGTIAAAKNGKGIVGVAPGVKVAAVRVSEGSNSWFYPENVICGFVWAADHDFRVTNNSYYVDPWLYNCPTDKDQAAIAEGVTRAAQYAERNGTLNVVAAGNEGRDLAAATRSDSTSPNDGTTQSRPNLPKSCVEMPQEVPGVVMVAGTDSSGTKYSGSNHGVDVIDVAAPAVNVKSTVPNNGYGTKTGTSMASPHVAGVAALLASKHPSATPDQLRELLHSQAQNWPCSKAGGTTCVGTDANNSIFGEGVVDAYKAVTEDGGGNQAPSKPGNLRSTGRTQTSVSLAWDASTDDQGVTGYNVYNGGSLATTVTGTSATVSGLTAGTSYTFRVKAKDQPGLESPASDPVSVTTEGDGGGGLTNGGFEAGDLSGWTLGGTAQAGSVLTSGAHEGSRAARLGSTSATNGESTLSQTFTAPAGSSQLSLHYSMTCPDTVTYAWAKVVLLDKTSGQTTMPLGKTCTSGAGWKQVTAALTPGHSYTLSLVNRDDNHPDDPVYTAYDAVTVN